MEINAKADFKELNSFKMQCFMQKIKYFKWFFVGISCDLYLPKFCIAPREKETCE